MLARMLEVATSRDQFIGRLEEKEVRPVVVDFSVTKSAYRFFPFTPSAPMGALKSSATMIILVCGIESIEC